jgi:hypothetical protein
MMKISDIVAFLAKLSINDENMIPTPIATPNKHKHGIVIMILL